MLYSHNHKHNDLNPTVHIQMQIHKQIKMQTDSVFQVRTVYKFLTSVFRHEERDTILKSLS